MPKSLRQIIRSTLLVVKQVHSLKFYGLRQIVFCNLSVTSFDETPHKSYTVVLRFLSSLIRTKNSSGSQFVTIPAN